MCVMHDARRFFINWKTKKEVSSFVSRSKVENEYINDSFVVVQIKSRNKKLLKTFADMIYKYRN